jgi:hypothetical protein
LLFRSEEHLERWRRQQQAPRGEVLSLQQLWDLAVAWYQQRLDPNFSGRSVAEAQAVFRKIGLTSPFWMAEQ